jgi:hypothetical protein
MVWIITSPATGFVSFTHTKLGHLVANCVTSNYKEPSLPQTTLVTHVTCV